MAIIPHAVRYGSIAVALAGVAAIVSVIRLQQDHEMPRSDNPLRPPANKPYAHAVAATGILEALNDNVAIGVPQPGLVTEVLVQVHARVTQGDVLFRLDDRDIRAQQITTRAKLAAATAQVAVHRAQLAKFQSQLQRLTAVDDPRAISRDDLENRRQDVAMATAQLDAATADVATIEAELASLDLLDQRLSVRAPRAGSILQVNLRAGEYASTSPKAPAMILGRVDRLQVRADVDEQNATRIRPGQTARASLKGDPSAVFELEFVRVEPYVVPKVSLTGAGTERVDTRVLQVIFALDPPSSPPLYVGQQVDVFIEAPEHPSP